MSATLPTIDGQCCLPQCEDVLIQNIPGPAGADGADGAAGTDGVSSTTTLTLAFTMPAELSSDTATVVSTAGLVIGQNVYVQGLGILQVAAILGPTQATLKNLEDTPNSAYASNAAPGTIAAIGSRIGPGSIQGPAGILAGAAAGGDLKGTYPNPTLARANGLGTIVVGNGTDAMDLSAGVNGQILAYDSAQPLGMLAKAIIPITGGAQVADNRIARLDGATGLPIPIQSSKVEVSDNGAIAAVGSGGDARGTDAVDLQVNRAVAGSTAVASGARSVIAGGKDNVASGAQSVVVGGNNNANSGLESFIGGGIDNIIDSTQSAIVGGDTNKIIGGAVIESFIGGGKTNKIIAGATQAVLAGGSTNTVSSVFGSLLGGAANLVSGKAASIVGGTNATADKQGQRAFSSGPFSAQADCQQSDLIWRCATVGIVGATEMFLDGAGASQRAIIDTGRTVAFDILITARSSAGLNAAWTVKGIINNLAGTVTIATAVVNALLADNSGATFGTLANIPVVAADNVNKALVITVANAAATNVRWAAHARLMEIGY